MPRLSTGRVVVWAIAGGAVTAVAVWMGQAREAHAQSSLAAPASCTCSAPYSLPGTAAGPSLLYNCQCGSLQCVASVFTPPTRPEGNGPVLVCVR